jgi:hypothetical protein
VRRALAILLLGLIGVLPSIDAVACPDGCSDATHAGASWERGERCAGTAGCGLCLNGCYVPGHPSIAIGPDCLAPMPPPPPTDLPLADSASIERPPRIA